MVGSTACHCVEVRTNTQPRCGFMSTRVPDAWDDEEILQNDDFPPLPKRVKPTKEKIRDEWDDEDEDDKALENSANVGKPDVESAHRGQSITPVILKPQTVSPYNGGSSGSSFPPELSFEPAVRILKRPKPAGPQSSNSSANSNERKTLQEREEKYRQARERIFGSSSPTTSATSTPNRVSSPMGTNRAEEQFNGGREEQIPRKASPASFARPIREPLGPDTHSAFIRRPGPGPTNSVPSSKAS